MKQKLAKVKKVVNPINETIKREWRRELLFAFVTLVLTLLFTGCSTDAEDSVNAHITAIDDDAQVVIRGVVNGSYSAIQVDNATGAMVILDDIHHEIHEGDTFYSYDITDLGNGENRTILLVTPVSPTAHFYWEVECELETKIEIFEGIVNADNGTAMPTYNVNRNSSDNSTVLIRHTPTIISLGTLIYEVQVGSGRRAGGTGSALNELMLKNNERYIMRITNQTVNPNVVSGKMIWYEHQ